MPDWRVDVPSPRSQTVTPPAVSTACVHKRPRSRVDASAINDTSCAKRLHRAAHQSSHASPLFHLLNTSGAPHYKFPASARTCGHSKRASAPWIRRWSCPSAWEDTPRLCVAPMAPYTHIGCPTHRGSGASEKPGLVEQRASVSSPRVRTLYASSSCSLRLMRRRSIPSRSPVHADC